MNYKVSKKLTKEQWQIVISLLKDAIYETDCNVAKYDKVSEEFYITMKKQKNEFEEILTELE